MLHIIAVEVAFTNDAPILIFCSILVMTLYGFIGIDFKLGLLSWILMTLILVLRLQNYTPVATGIRLKGF